MENVVPDNEHLSKLADSIEDLHKQIRKDISYLRDTKGDIFMRYMAYCRSMNYVEAVEFGLGMFYKNIAAGHSIGDEILQTKKAKENEWGSPNIKNNPFFINPSQNVDSDNDMPDSLKELLVDALFSKIMNIKKETH